MTQTGQTIYLYYLNLTRMISNVKWRDLTLNLVKMVPVNTTLVFTIKILYIQYEIIVWLEKLKSQKNFRVLNQKIIVFQSKVGSTKIHKINSKFKYGDFRKRLEKSLFVIKLTFSIWTAGSFLTSLIYSPVLQKVPITWVLDTFVL